MTVDAVFICLLRYKNELDRSQPAGSSLSSSSSELQPYTTPQKSFSTPAPVAAYRHQGILVCYKTLCLEFMLNASYGFMLLEFPFLHYLVLNLGSLLSRYIPTRQAGAKTNLSDIATSYLLGNLYLSQRCVYFFFIDNRLDELQEKYNQEVEERKRLETELKVLQVKVSKT